MSDSAKAGSKALPAKKQQEEEKDGMADDLEARLAALKM